MASLPLSALALFMVRLCVSSDGHGPSRGCFVLLSPRALIPAGVSQAFCFTGHKFRDMGGFPNIVMMEVTTKKGFSSPGFIVANRTKIAVVVAVVVSSSVLRRRLVRPDARYLIADDCCSALLLARLFLALVGTSIV